MADAAWEELRGLFGQAIDSPAVTAFLAKYAGHKVGKPSDGRQYVTASKHGLELCFGLPDGAYSGGRTAHLRVLITAFLNSAAVPRNKAFAALPLGLSFADTHDLHVARFGPPEFVRAWPSGEMHSARWRLPEVAVFVDYLQGQPGVKMFTLMLPSAVPAAPGATADPAG